MKIFILFFIVLLSGKLVAFEPVASYGNLFTETLKFNTNKKHCIFFEALVGIFIEHQILVFKQYG